ncbi:MAG: tetratricopeptide repeat protein [Planctomycetota bacterium]
MFRCASVVPLVLLAALAVAPGEEAQTRPRESAGEIRRQLVRKLELASQVALGAGDLERAAWAFSRLARLDEKNESYAFELANMLLALGRTEEAREELRRLSGRLGADARVLFLEGVAAAQEKRPDERDRLFAQAQDAVASSAAALGVADFFDRLGRPEIAEMELEKIHAGFDEEAAYANIRLAETRWIMGEYAEALPLYERAAELLGSLNMDLRGQEGPVVDARLRICRAFLALRAGKEATGESELRALLDDPSVGVEAGILLVNHYKATGQEGLGRDVIERKVARLEEAVARDPEDSSAYNTLAWFLSQVGQDLERARTLSESSLRIEPLAPAYLDTLAEISHRMGDSKGAVDHERTAIALRPIHRRYYESQLRKFGAD